MYLKNIIYKFLCLRKLFYIFQDILQGINQNATIYINVSVVQHF